MAARQLCWPPAILFYRCRSFKSLFFSSSPNLRGRLADRHQTLPHVRWWPRFIKFGQKFGWPLPRNLASQNIKITARFRTTSRLDREYLRNATRHRQSENYLRSSSFTASCLFVRKNWTCTRIYDKPQLLFWYVSIYKWKKVFEPV